ncbi:hypothetical protein M8J75_006521 [Diaphorina citri]|nr:hypothetical protein M8J75_006521 [Diaphorina citri]
MSLDEKCKACLEDLPVEGTHVICSKCGGGLHYTCSSVSEASWHSMGQAKKNAWKCADCRTRKPLANQMLTRSGSNSSLASSSGDVGEGNRRDETFQLSGLEVLLNKKFKEFEKVIDKKIGKIEGRLQEIERGLEFVGNSVDDLKKSCKEIEKKVITVEKKQETMEAQNQELRKKVKDLEIAMQEMAQDLNQSKVEITGVPQNVNHSVFMEKVLEKINVVPAIVIQTKVADHYFVASQIYQTETRAEENRKLKEERQVEVLNTRQINREIEEFKWEDWMTIEDPERIYSKIVDKFQDIYKKCSKFLTPQQLAKLITITQNFTNPQYRQRRETSYQLRHQPEFVTSHRFNNYGERLKSYAVPKLLSKYCQTYLEETNITLIKTKLMSQLTAEIE